MWCCVVLYGVVRHGMAWYGVVWYGLVWCGTVWLWDGTGLRISRNLIFRLRPARGNEKTYVVQCNDLRCGRVWCGMVWYGMV